LRIIGGTHKGRVIHVPSKLNLRPTTDLAREGLFNILLNRLDPETISFLDLFSGTGCMSYEMASRGCSVITCVELNNQHARFIKQSSEKLGFSNIQLIQTDAYKYLQRSKSKYDLIFADPPYDHKQLTELPGIVFDNELLLPKGQFILEHGKFNSFQNHPNFKELRKYGAVHFSFFNYTS